MSTLGEELDAVFGRLYGAVFISTVMTTAFYSVACMQTFTYYVNHQDDHLHTKCFVGVMWALNTVHEVLILSGAYKCIIRGLGNPISIIIGIPELVFQSLLTALVAVPIQGYFVYRIYIFSGNNVIPPLVWSILGIFQLISTLIYVSKSLYISDGIRVIALTEITDHFFKSMATSALSVAAAMDILIAVAMTYLLVRKRTSACFPSTTNILRRLIVFSVNTGTWTAVFALLALILINAFPSDMIYVVFAIPLCSIYCNTLLANLNARSYIRGDSSTHHFESHAEQAMMGSGSGSGSGASDVMMIDRRLGEPVKSSSSVRQAQAVGVWQNAMVTFQAQTQFGTSENA